eukprot:759057-Hanusia_phi.AAC.5
MDAHTSLLPLASGQPDYHSTVVEGKPSVLHGGRENVHTEILLFRILRPSPDSSSFCQLGEACILTNVIMSLTVDMVSCSLAGWERSDHVAKISTSLHRLYSIRFPTTREV